MKKLGIMFALAGVIAFGFSSCGGDEDDTVAKPTPKFDWKTGGAYTSTNVSKPAGTILYFGIDATGSEDLTSVGVRVKTNGGQETTIALSADGGDSILDKKTKNIALDFEYELGVTPGTTVFTAIVKMSNGTQTSKSINVTVTSVPEALQEAPNHQMGGQSNANRGSYFSMSTNKVLVQAEANADPAAVDWIYYYGTQNQATFAAPNNSTLQSSNVMNNPALSTWTTKRATRFKKLPASFDFAAATNNTDIDGELATGTWETDVKDMQIGDVIMFRTENDQAFGIVKITALTTGAASNLDFDLKFHTK